MKNGQAKLAQIENDLKVTLISNSTRYFILILPIEMHRLLKVAICLFRPVQLKSRSSMTSTSAYRRRRLTCSSSLPNYPYIDSQKIKILIQDNRICPIFSQKLKSEDEIAKLKEAMRKQEQELDKLRNNTADAEKDVSTVAKRINR